VSGTASAGVVLLLGSLGAESSALVLTASQGEFGVLDGVGAVFLIFDVGALTLGSRAVTFLETASARPVSNQMFRAVRLSRAGDGAATGVLSAALDESGDEALEQIAKAAERGGSSRLMSRGRRLWSR